jgi:hypothetical protein
VALKRAFQRLTTPVSELDRGRLREFCSVLPGVIPAAQAQPRQDVRLAGEVVSVRMVPRRDGSPWLEATVTDGSARFVAMWTGRRKIAGIKGGQRLIVSGRALPNGPGGRLLFFNPAYELLA